MPKIDKNICDGCGTCSQMCKFNALAVVKKQVLLFEQLCHGCGVCTYFCPLKAIYEEKRTIGVIEQGKAGDIQFSAGCLDIGEPMATPIIKALKKNIINNGIAILDAAPGTSCPAVEAISGCHFCLLVTEPTPFGLHDLKLAVAMCRQLEVPAAVVLNRSDLGDNSVEKFCEKENLPILLKIPFNREIAMAYSEGKMLLESVPGFAANIERLIEGIWARLKEKEENSVFPSDPKDKFWQAGVGI